MHAWLSLLVLLLLSTAASGQTVYKWVDEETGEVHYSHAVPPEHIEKAHERLAADGRITARVERAPTHEERQRLAEELAQERDETERDRIRASRDRLLLASYPSETDLQRSMQADLDLIAIERETILRSLASARAHFEELVALAAEKERMSESVPEDLAGRIIDSRRQVVRITVQLERVEARLASTEASYRSDLERYRALSGGPRG